MASSLSPVPWPSGALTESCSPVFNLQPSFMLSWRVGNSCVSSHSSTRAASDGKRQAPSLTSTPVTGSNRITPSIASHKLSSLSPPGHVRNMTECRKKVNDFAQFCIYPLSVRCLFCFALFQFILITHCVTRVIKMRLFTQVNGNMKLMHSSN